jgi:hypothetical protein
MKRNLLIACMGMLLLGTNGCKKGKADFVLTGAITNTTFSIPMTGAVVQLYGTEAGGSATNLISEMTLSADGLYSFTFPRDQIETYHLKVTKADYFSIEKDIPFADLTIENDNVRNYATTAKSWVKLRFVNTAPLPTDVLQYIKQDGKEGCDECCGDADIFLNGAVDTTIYCINDGNTEYSYYYWVHGTTNQGLRAATTTAFDTVEILLNY